MQTSFGRGAPLEMSYAVYNAHPALVIEKAGVAIEMAMAARAKKNLKGDMVLHKGKHENVSL